MISKIKSLKFNRLLLKNPRVFIFPNLSFSSNNQIALIKNDSTESQFEKLKLFQKNYENYSFKFKNSFKFISLSLLAFLSTTKIAYCEVKDGYFESDKRKFKFLF